MTSSISSSGELIHQSPILTLLADGGEIPTAENLKSSVAKHLSGAACDLQSAGSSSEISFIVSSSGNKYLLIYMCVRVSEAIFENVMIKSIDRDRDFDIIGGGDTKRIS